VASQCVELETARLNVYGLKARLKEIKSTVAKLKSTMSYEKNYVYVVCRQCVDRSLQPMLTAVF